jgi:cobalt/nickel transport system permease protein
MHIPDGFLSAPVWITMGAASVPAVGYTARRAQREIEESRAPLLGVMGAFVFAAQMINFPVGVGTTGHLVGAALLAFTLGPASAAVVMTAILAIQALVFQDGGVLALGANVFNMAFLGVLAAYLPYRFWGEGRRRKFGIFLGAALSVIVAGLLAMAELLLSGVPMPGAIIWVSVALFAVTAMLEGGITLAVIQALEVINPGWLKKPSETGRPAMAILAVIAVLLVSVGVLIASSNPDGLEKLAESLGIASHARSLFETPLTGYEFQFLTGSWLRKASAGMAGLALIFGVCALFSRIISRQRSA